MVTNRQKNNAKARKNKARQEEELQAQTAYLQENKAWNWVWPQTKDGKAHDLPRNCWYTGLAPRTTSSTHDGNELYGTQPYFGPSKRTLKRRAARRGLRTVEAEQFARFKVGV